MFDDDEFNLDPGAFVPSGNPTLEAVVAGMAAVSEMLNMSYMQRIREASLRAEPPFGSPAELNEFKNAMHLATACLMVKDMPALRAVLYAAGASDTADELMQMQDAMRGHGTLIKMLALGTRVIGPPPEPLLALLRKAFPYFDEEYAAALAALDG